jgi:hypothetical protein
VPTIIQILLALSCTVSAPLLALQIGLAEGWLFKRPLPPVPTSTSAERLLEKQTPPSRPRMSSVASLHSTSAFPHLQKSSLDSESGVRHSIDVQVDARTSRVSRAMSMMKPHPKLMLLSSGSEEPSHELRQQRSRSFSLSRASKMGEQKGMRRCPDCVKRFRLTNATTDQTCSRLSLIPSSSRTKVMDEEARPYEIAHHKKRTPSPTPPSSTTKDKHNFFSDSPFSPKGQRNHSASSAASSAIDYTIDFLSSQILPRLVPSVCVFGFVIVAMLRTFDPRRSRLASVRLLRRKGSI